MSDSKAGDVSKKGDKDNIEQKTEKNKEIGEQRIYILISGLNILTY